MYASTAVVSSDMHPHSTNSGYCGTGSYKYNEGYINYLYASGKVKTNSSVPTTHNSNTCGTSGEAWGSGYINNFYTQRLYKSSVTSGYIEVYDASTSAYLATYRYKFT